MIGSTVVLQANIVTLESTYVMACEVSFSRTGYPDVDEDNIDIIVDGCLVDPHVLRRSELLRDLLTDESVILSGSATLPLQPQAFRAWTAFKDGTDHSLQDLVQVLQACIPSFETFEAPDLYTTHANI